MKVEPLVSVIVSVDKVEDIYGCVESIMEQTYHNLEIILVVNISCDRCQLICDNLVLMDHRIIIVDQQLDIKVGIKDNLRISAFYDGLIYATGSYVTFVDSKVRLKKNMIRTLVGMCSKYQCQISSSNNSNERFKKNKIMVYRNNAAFMSRKFPLGLYGKLFDISLFEETSIPAGDNYDQVIYSVLYRLFYKAKKVSIINKEMYYESIDEDKSQISKITNIKDYMNMFEDRINYFEEREEKLLELSHEYYCKFLAYFYLYLLKTREDELAMKMILEVFKKELSILKTSSSTPIHHKFFMFIIYYCPKLSVSILTLLPIDPYQRMLKYFNHL